MNPLSLLPNTEIFNTNFNQLSSTPWSPQGPGMRHLHGASAISEVFSGVAAAASASASASIRGGQGSGSSAYPPPFLPSGVNPRRSLRPPPPAPARPAAPTPPATPTTNAAPRGPTAPNSPAPPARTPPSGSQTPSTANESCEDVASVAASWRQFEDDVLKLSNGRRAQGADCGRGGSFAPTGPLKGDASLRCAARRQSRDMAEEDFFEHQGLDGSDPDDRTDAAGFAGRYLGENIAAGTTTAAAVVNGWMNSAGHCANIMNPNSNRLGVGYYKDADPADRYGTYWTQNFGFVG